MCTFFAYQIENLGQLKLSVYGSFPEGCLLRPAVPTFLFVYSSFTNPCRVIYSNSPKSSPGIMVNPITWVIP